MRDLLFYIIPVIVAALTEPAAELVFRVHALLNRLPAWAKQIVVAVITYGLTKASALLGAPANDPQALMAAALTYLFHLGRK